MFWKNGYPYYSTAQKYVTTLLRDETPVCRISSETYIAYFNEKLPAPRNKSPAKFCMLKQSNCLSVICLSSSFEIWLLNFENLLCSKIVSKNVLHSFLF